MSAAPPRAGGGLRDPDGRWTFLTNQGHVLVALSLNPDNPERAQLEQFIREGREEEATRSQED